MGSTESTPSQKRPYVFSTTRQSWEMLQSSPHATQNGAPTQIHLISWNVDFSQPYVDQRCVAAIETIRSHLAQATEAATHEMNKDSLAPAQGPSFKLPSAVPDSSQFAAESDPDISVRHIPVVIQLQEVEGDGLEPLLEHPWLRRYFLATDIDAQRLGRYFTITFLDKRLAGHIGRIHRLPLQNSQMGRDALFVDLTMQGGETLRLANTHLESLDHRPPRRPAQLETIAAQLKDVAGGVVAGDFNPVSKGDDKLPAQVGLTDLWVPLDTADDVAEREQHTWGYWPGEKPYPPQRLDKICAIGRAKLAKGRVARVGLGAKCIIQETVPLSIPVFVSDHCALEAYLTLAPADG